MARASEERVARALEERVVRASEEREELSLVSLWVDRELAREHPQAYHSTGWIANDAP